METSISKPRGDTIKIRFGIKIDGKPYQVDTSDRLYMTIKKSYKDTEFLFQYTLDSGITYDDTTKKYILVIPSSDTATLDYRVYPFDIELVRNFDSTRDTTTLVVGELEMTPEITMRGNE